MQTQNTPLQIPQYSLGKIIFVWAAAAAPMAILGWVVGPALARDSASMGLARLGGLTVGLIWQFVLVLIMLRREGSSMRWSDLTQRLWLLKPSSDEGRRPDGRLWWWLIPLFLVTAFYQMKLGPVVEHLWVSIFPMLAEPSGFSTAGFLESPAGRASLVGNWGMYALFLVQMFFNTVAGEELLFRGLLLPRMAGVFRKWDWLANGVLFGFYHWHQPWSMLGSVVDGALMYAFPSRRFRSAWFGIIAHSGQSLFFAFLLLGLVLGLA